MKLHLNTVSELLWDSLNKLMKIEAFNSFRLVGGTALSLQLGHRESLDIDLFTDAEYGSIDFLLLEEKLTQSFAYVEMPIVEIVGMGKSYFIGESKNDLVKLDLYYTDTYVFPILIEKNIRFSSLEEIAAMKLEVVAHGGRKKDFWDLHQLLETYSLDQLMEFYLKRNPFAYSKEHLLKQILDFSNAEHDFIPNCFKNKDWEIIKLDFEDLIRE